MKLKKKKNEWVDLQEYIWPDAFFAFKAYVTFCYIKKKQKIKKVTPYVHPLFIKDILFGMYDEDFFIKELENHHQKQDLLSIKDVKISSLLSSNPMLMTHLF